MKIFTDLQACLGHLVLLGFMISFYRLSESDILMRLCVSLAYALGKKFTEMQLLQLFRMIYDEFANITDEQKEVMTFNYTTLLFRPDRYQ